MAAKIIEYSIDGGNVWHHGRTIEAWAADDNFTLRGQRAAVRENAREWHRNVENVTTCVLAEDDERAVLNQPAS